MRKKRNGFISFMVAVILLLGAFLPTVAFAEETKIYSDVKDTIYEKAVKALTEEGVLNGYEDGTFKPEGNITRAEVSMIFGTIIYDNYEGDEKNIASEKEMKKYASDSFGDLAGYSWASKCIGIAAKMNIVEGYGNKVFRPGNSITYNELVAMTVRATNYDMSEITSAWPENYMNAGEKLKLFEGMKDFKPYEEGNKTATRGHTAIIVNNALKTIKEACKAGYADGNKVVTAKNTKRLSLEDAIKIMQTTGLLADLSRANRESDWAIAQGHQESITSVNAQLSPLYTSRSAIQAAISGTTDSAIQANLRSALNELNSGIDAAEKGRSLYVLQRDFVEDHVTDNYQADMNNIEATTYQLYYGLMQAEENVEVSRVALEVVQQTLANTKKKFEVGMASSLDVQNQEYNVLSAENTYRQAVLSEMSAEMNFCMLLDIDEDTELILTTPMKKTDKKLPALNDAIKSMKSKNLMLDYYDYLLSLTGKTAEISSGASKAKAEAAFDQAAVALKQTRVSMEIELTSAYSELPALEKKIETMEATLNLAEKGLEVSQIQYKNGMITAVDLKKAENSVLQAKLGLTNAIANYNMAVYDIIFASGVGTSRITFQQ